MVQNFYLLKIFLFVLRHSSETCGIPVPHALLRSLVPLGNKSQKVLTAQNCLRTIVALTGQFIAELELCVTSKVCQNILYRRIPGCQRPSALQRATRAAVSFPAASTSIAGQFSSLCPCKAYANHIMHALHWHQ